MFKGKNRIFIIYFIHFKVYKNQYFEDNMFVTWEKGEVKKIYKKCQVLFEWYLDN